MAEYWIVTSKRYNRHASLEAAAEEMRARAERNPGTKFHVIRCKKSLHPAKHFTKLVQLLKDIVREGLTKANRDRALVLISTIETRGRS